MPTFDTPDPISATITLAVATVRVTAGDRPHTVVDVQPSDPSRPKDVRAAELIRVACTDGGLLIDAPKLRSWHGASDGSVEVAIELPAGSHLHAAVGVGDIETCGRLGDCRVRTGVGQITVDRVDTLSAACGVGDIAVARATGRAEVTAGSGDLRLAALDGAALLKNANGDTWVGVAHADLRLQASNGDIAVDQAHAGVEAKSANGDVRLRDVVRGAVVIESQLGDLEVGVHEGTAAWLDIRAALGEVHIELDDADIPDPAAETVSVRARSSLGRILVRRS